MNGWRATHFGVDSTYRLLLLQVRNEIAVLKRVSMGHQNILTLVDYFETMNNRMHRYVGSFERHQILISRSLSRY